MLAHLRFRLSPEEPVIAVEGGALYPLPIAERFIAVLLSITPDAEVWLIRCAPGSAALLYPDAYALACERFPRFLTAPAAQATPNDKSPRRGNAEDSEELNMDVQAQGHCSATTPGPPARRAS